MKQLTLLFAAALAVAACSSEVDTTDDALTVKVQDNSFSPAAKTITAGQTITWKWTGSQTHSVTFSEAVSSVTQTSGTYSRLFPLAGTYHYQCAVHGSAMSGTITVTAASGSGITN